MKKIFLSLVAVLIFPVLAMAEVAWEHISVVQDVNGNIEVHTQYKVDGVEAVSRYPQEGGKYYWVTRYDAQNFIGMSEAQILAVIDANAKEFADYLQKQAWIKIENDKILATRLTNLVGSKGKVTQTDIEVDTDGDNKADKIFTVKSTGEKVNEKVLPTP